jgi:hypothetical protein
MKSFWGSMQIELMNRQKWRTKLELSLAMADYIENFYSSDRRHSSLGYRTPNEFEDCTQPPASRPLCPKKWSTEWGLPHRVEVLGRYSNPSCETENLRKLAQTEQSTLAPKRAKRPKQVQLRLPEAAAVELVAAYQAGDTIEDLVCRQLEALMFSVAVTAWQ